MKTARTEERGLQSDIDQCRHRFESMNSELVGVQAHLQDFEDKVNTVNREIEENTERLKAANRQWARILADNNSSNPDSAFTVDLDTFEETDPSPATTPSSSKRGAPPTKITATLESLDVMTYQQKELFQEAMTELKKLADEHPELNIAEKVQEKGLKFSTQGSGYISGSSSRASSSRAPSDTGGR